MDLKLLKSSGAKLSEHSLKGGNLLAGKAIGSRIIGGGKVCTHSRETHHTALPDQLSGFKCNLRRNSQAMHPGIDLEMNVQQRAAGSECSSERFRDGRRINDRSK